jgi:hypothetical protein
VIMKSPVLDRQIKIKDNLGIFIRLVTVVLPDP